MHRREYKAPRRRGKRKAISFYLFLLCSVARCKVGILEDDGDESLNKSGEEELRLLGFLCPEEFSCEGDVGAVALASRNVSIRTRSPSEQSAGCLFVFATKLFFVCLFAVFHIIVDYSAQTTHFLVIRICRNRLQCCSSTFFFLKKMFHMKRTFLLKRCTKNTHVLCKPIVLVCDGLLAITRTG